MKYTKKEFEKYNINLSDCVTYDDVIVTTVEGNVKNGAVIDKHMFEQYKAIIGSVAIQTFVESIKKLGNTAYFNGDEIEIYTKNPFQVDPSTVDKNVEKKPRNPFVKFYNWITRKNK